jgi:hypothetical protein
MLMVRRGTPDGPAAVPGDRGLALARAVADGAGTKWPGSIAAGIAISPAVATAPIFVFRRHRDTSTGDLPPRIREVIF